MPNEQFFSHIMARTSYIPKGILSTTWRKKKKMIMPCYDGFL